MVRKRSSSEVATGATRATATPWSSRRRSSLRHDLAIDRRPGAKGHAQAALVVARAGHAGHRGQQAGRLNRAVTQDVDRPRPAAHQLVEQVRGQQHCPSLADELANQAAELENAQALAHA